MKRLILTIILFVGIVYCYAQDNPCAKYDGRAMPDWIMGATPEPHNNTYYYKVFEGANSDREVARNMAIKKAFQQAITFIDATVNSADVFAAIEKGGNLNVLSDTYHIPIYFTCEYSKKTPDGTQWIYWILCQIAIRGNVVPQFDTHFTDCNTHDIWDKQKEECLKGIKKAEQNKNAKVLAISLFLPGVGQMTKGHYVEGSVTLVGELALLGAGVGTYFGAKKQTQIMNSYGIDYATYQAAQKAKPIYQGVSYACFGLAAVLYGVNLWRAYTLEPKRRSYAFYPTIISTDNTNYALGLGATIKF